MCTCMCVYMYMYTSIFVLSLYIYIYIYTYIQRKRDREGDVIFFAGRHRDVRVPGIRHASKRTLSRSANAFRGPVGGPRGR